MLKRLHIVALATVLALGAAFAQEQVDIGRGENREADLAMRVADAEQFVGIAGVGNNFEIQSSQVALERSQNADVRAFAEMMIADHTAMGEALAEAVSAAGLPFAPPNDIDTGHAEKMDDIRTITADQFDRTYLRWQIQVHQVAVALFSGYSQNGDNEQLRQFAATGLPKVQAHLDHLLAMAPQPGD